MIVLIVSWHHLFLCTNYAFVPTRQCYKGCDGMIARRGTGAIVHARISANATWLGGIIAVADTRERRIQSRRSGIMASNWLIARGSLAAAWPASPCTRLARSGGR